MSEKKPKTSKAGAPKAKIYRARISERDYKLLRYLWRWKVGTSAALSAKFFPAVKRSSAFRRLMYLQASGYITMIEFQGKGIGVWSLTDRGFRYIRPRLKCEHDGYKSENIYHDFITSALHLGPWLTQMPDHTETFSEQELRRNSPDCYPTWVPRTDMHRPDGYSIFFEADTPVVVAFEAELSSKATARFERVVAFYDAQDEITYFIWLVDSKTRISAIKHGFDKFQMRKRSKHQFILERDFLESGWQSRVSDGSLRGKMLSDILPHKPITNPSTSHPVRDELALLDFRKRPF